MKVAVAGNVSVALLTLVLLSPLQAADPLPIKAVLPGLQANGIVQLPNQWKLNPAGKQLLVGDFPGNIQIHPTGQYAAVLHYGMRDHEVQIIDLNPAKQKIVCRIVIDQGFFGLTWSNDGKSIYASGGEFDLVHVWDFDKGLLYNHRTLDVSGVPGVNRVVPSGITLDRAGQNLYACGLWADALIRVPLTNPDNRTVIALSSKDVPILKNMGSPPSPPDNRKEGEAPEKPKRDPNSTEPMENNSFPYACVLDTEGKRAFVSMWAKAAVAVVDLEENKLISYWQTASHPTEMILAPNGKTLYVACSNSTQVTVIDVVTGKTLQTINAALYPQAPSGNTPSSLSMTPDGQVLFVANSDANNLSVFNIADPKMAKAMGFIPTGWYPTSVRYNKTDKTIYVANGKGALPKANPSGPNPNLRYDKGIIEYIGTLFQGTLSMIPMPNPQDMAKYSQQAYECSPLQNAAAVNTGKVEADNPIPTKVGGKSPIKHVIYIVKENRTYDQVFGDLPQGNGQKELAIFGEEITPNHHKLAQEFVLLDNIYVDGEVSADGHEWSMGAYATDFVEKLWPLSYRGSPKQTFGYPAEGVIDYAARPAGGYIWDRAKEAGISYRSYGEWVRNGKKNDDGTFEDGTATVPALVGNIDPQFRSYDLDYTDINRAKRFISEVKRFENEGKMPQLQIVRIPNDHTSGTRVGKPTPRAQVADNDVALGMIVEAVSNSKFWESTAIFVIEDDAQNGPDHVDAHRVVALVISPYTKRKHVDSTLYSTSSMLRTMELILGLKPMSQFDAAARPMYNSFKAKMDKTPYKAVPAKIDVNELNKADAWGAALSEKLNLATEDQADDLIFNEIIWKSVKGANSPMPAPVRAAFFVPVTAKRDDDDDDNEK